MQKTAQERVKREVGDLVSITVRVAPEIIGRTQFRVAPFVANSVAPLST